MPAALQAWLQPDTDPAPELTDITPGRRFAVPARLRPPVPRRGKHPGLTQSQAKAHNRIIREARGMQRAMPG